MSNTQPAGAIQGRALDQLFRTARTRNGWTPRPVAEQLMRRIYDLAKFGPTSANTCPGRFVFVASAEAKARLLKHVAEGNRAKTAAAPVCVIAAYDTNFPALLPRLFPQRPGLASAFADDAVREETAFRNGTLQAAYLMMAARALGLDCGPMSGFDAKGVNAEFFAGSSFRANFLCNIGYGSDEGLFPRNPRLTFDEACQIL